MADWRHEEIGVGVTRCPPGGGYRPPRTRVQFAAEHRANRAALMHGEGMTRAAIARELGVSYSRVVQLIERAWGVGGNREYPRPHAPAYAEAAELALWDQIVTAVACAPRAAHSTDTQAVGSEA